MVEARVVMVAYNIVTSGNLGHTENLVTDVWSTRVDIRVVSMKYSQSIHPGQVLWEVQYCRKRSQEI